MQNIDPQTIDLSTFPSSKCSTLKEWVDAIGRTLWNPHHKKIAEFFKTPCLKYTDVLFTLQARNIHNLSPLPGWSKLGERGFEKVTKDDLPEVMVFDCETVRAHADAPYKPFLAFAWGDGYYWAWLPESGSLPDVIPFPANRIVIGQNSTPYDRRYLSSEYDQENFFAPNLIHIDTFCLATMVCGLSNQQKTAYETQKKQAKEGKGSKEWVSRASARDLASLCKHFCGIEISKTVRKDSIETKFEKDFNFHRLPKDVVDYCAQDVWATFHLADRLFARVDKEFFSSPVSWWGVQELSQSRFHLKDYESFLESSERDYQAVKKENAELVSSLAHAEMLKGLEVIEAFDQEKMSKVRLKKHELLEQAAALDFEGVMADSSIDAFEDFLKRLGFCEVRSEVSWFYENGCFRFQIGLIKYVTGWDTALKKGGEKLKTKLINFLKKRLEREEKKLEKSLYGIVPPGLREGLDWTRVTVGENKGSVRWFVGLVKNGFEINRDAILLMGITWKDLPIYWEPIKTEKGQTGTWRTDDERLPHPKGPDKNLDSPLCKDYLVWAKSGELKSKALGKDALISLFERLESIAQWTSFRTRLGSVYRLPAGELQLTTGDIAPIGTVTRRVTSPIWQVSPKPSEKIGSGLMKHVSVPNGFSMVGTDFDQEESWMATVLTDARGGKIGSNPWCRSVLDGDKEKGTDDHSLTAKQLGIPRGTAKTLNFASAYGAGLLKLAVALSLELELPLRETLVIASNFLYFKRGELDIYKSLNKALGGIGLSRSEAFATSARAFDNYVGTSGVQKTTFDTLSIYADTPNIRTALLNVKVPDTLNKCFVKDEFFTSRNNWQIQSPCVDVLHILLTIIRAFSIEYDVEYWFIYAVHDSVFFCVRQGQESVFKAILQRSHQLVKKLTYEQALVHANNLKMPSQRKNPEGFECPESQYWFSEINVGQTVAEVI